MMQFGLCASSPARRITARLVLWTVLAVAIAFSTSASRVSLADDDGQSQSLVVLRQTGGIAGSAETTTIWDDGRVERTRNRPDGDRSIMRLAGGPAEASTLRATVESTGLLDLPEGSRGGSSAP